VANFLLLGGTVLLLARLAGGSAHPEARLTKALLVLFYPVLFYVAGTFYAQTLGDFLFAAALVQWFALPGRTWPAFTGGLTFGALILTVPSFLLTFFVVLILGALLRLLPPRSVALSLLGAALFMLPWTLRNFATFHRFVPLASNSGMNLLLGNNATTLPYGGGENGSVDAYVAEAAARHFDEFDADRYFREEALRWMAAHPGRAMGLYIEKVANFFNPWNEYAPENNREISGWKQVVMGASYLLLLGLTGWRLVEARRGFPLMAREKLFLLIYLASAFTMAIFLTRIRLRLPYDELLMVVVAGHLCRRRLAARVSSRRRRAISRLGI
jgi:hypothetical protein